LSTLGLSGVRLFRPFSCATVHEREHFVQTSDNVLDLICSRLC
jgi:hypothetical protein